MARPPTTEDPPYFKKPNSSSSQQTRHKTQQDHDMAIRPHSATLQRATEREHQVSTVMSIPSPQDKDHRGHLSTP